MISPAPHTRIIDLNLRALTVWLTVVAVIGVCGIGWLAFKKPLTYTLAILAAPVAVWIATQPKVALLQFVFLLFIERMVVPAIPLFIIDLSAALVVGAAVLDILASPKLPQRLPPFTFNFLYIIAATSVCAVLGYWPHLITIRLLSWALLLGTFFAVYRLSRYFEVRSLVRWFFLFATLNAVYVLVPFLATGGAARSFGLSGKLFDDLMLVALPVGLALYLKSRQQHSLPYLVGTVICFGGLIATQSRLSIMFGLATCAFVLLTAYRQGSREDRDRRSGITRTRIWSILLLGGGLMVLAFVLHPDLLAAVLGRFQELLDNPFDRYSTVSLRLSLWNRAITAFLAHPVFGVGPGGFVRLFEIFPTMHLSFDYHLTSYMGAHNVLLQYLATTGLVGGVGLLAFVYNKYRLASSNLLHSPDWGSGADLALKAWAFAFVITVLIEGNWMWGQLSFVMAFLAALIARRFRQLEPTGRTTPQ